MDPGRTVVLVSADAEWQAVRDLLPAADLEITPLGETCLQAGLRCFHGGWGKVSAAASTQYVIDRYTPGLLVNLGTCGGLAGRVERGTVILAERTLMYDIHEQMDEAGQAAPWPGYNRTDS
jgi:adenosylhomocysteine nucleosidase